MTGEVWQDKPPLRLTLNKATSVDIAWQCKHCTGRGVMKLHRSGAASCRGYGSARLEDGKNQSKAPNPNSSFLENCPGSWLGEHTQRILAANLGDEAPGKMVSGQKFYHNVIPGSRFHSSWTTPSFSQDMCTEASYSCTATKGTCKASNRNVELAQGSVTDTRTCLPKASKF